MQADDHFHSTPVRDAPAQQSPWLAAAEGYYGPALEWNARLDLISWLGAHGYDGYVYAPKNDPLHRDRWREPYQAADMRQFDRLNSACDDHGMELVLSLSPGAGWQDDGSDVQHVVAKLADFERLGVRRFSIQWDDLFEGGASAGTRHGRAVAEIVNHFDDHIRWIACPDDYALAIASDYLVAFAEAVPPEVTVPWTGPGVLSRRFELADVQRLEAEIGRPLAFAENFPVNDLAMSDSLHLGPYPDRDPALRGHLLEVHVNFMHLPLASRIGLFGAAAFWKGTHPDRLTAWQAALDEIPGIEPIARGCRSWMDDPGPDQVLLRQLDAAATGDTQLRDFVTAGCRKGLMPEWQAELEPWLAQWEADADALLSGLAVLESLRSSAANVRDVWLAAQSWKAARAGTKQVFGTRVAMYGATRHDGSGFVAASGIVVAGQNLTDHLWTKILDRIEATDQLALASPRSEQRPK